MYGILFSMIHPGGRYDKGKFFTCRAIYYLAKELELGDKSTRAPYVRYLLSMPRGVMPGEWSKTGKEFLANVLGNGELPPTSDDWQTRFEDEWLEGCSGSDDNDMERVSYWLAKSRDEDTLMVPIYDMANHSNDPKKLNTISYKPKEAGDTFRFVASRKIMPGEQIYNSYNRCNHCSDVPSEDCETFSFSRTPDLFVDFGFVEDYPQSWELDPAILDSSDDSDDETELEFCLDKDAETGEWDTTWEDGEDYMPDEEDAKWLKKHLKRLQKLAKEKESLEKKLVSDDKVLLSTMSRWEWDSTWRYHEALVNAISAAITAVDDGSGDHDSRDEL